ncbi:MAG: PilZ domain-containing protein [Agarilytica sp.]
MNSSSPINEALMSDESNRRSEERIPHRAYATLITANNQYAAHLLNISRNGALIAVIQEHDLKSADEISLRIETETLQFELNGWVAHVRDHYLGMTGRPSNEKNRADLEAFISEAEDATKPEQP